jgi:tripartite-type tricarboxylate transporter receptor subunit TctC
LLTLGGLGRGGTPRAFVERLHHEIVKVVAMPDVRERLTALGFEPIVSTPQEFADRIKSEIAKWAEVIRVAGIKAQ